MRELYSSGYSHFIIPFVVGMVFVLSYCLLGALRIILELKHEDRRRLFLSLLNPKTMAKNLRDWFCDCLFQIGRAHV